ncbi:MAG: hypothetical protein ACYDHX_07850 [Methanothrix sp.]
MIDRMSLEARKAEVQQKIETDFSAAAPPALPDAKPEQSEGATITEEQIVEKVEEVPQEDATLRNVAVEPPEPARNKYGRFEEPVTTETDAEISRLDADGMDCREISTELAKKGTLLTWQRVRGRIVFMARTKHKALASPETSPSPSPPGVEGAPEEAARANPRGSLEEEKSAPKSAKPNPKLNYMEVADSKIINMKKHGMLNQEIAQALERNPGGSWTTQKVDARWTQLKREGLV